MARRSGAIAAAILAFAFAAQPLSAAEYFVRKQGADTNDGTSSPSAFLTIQKGINALKPGDTLTIAPGEYSENVELSEFGDLNRETLIRAEVPGTVILRADQNVSLDFAPVPDLRFVYVSNCDAQALSVQETDTLTNLSPATEYAALEFGPGRFFYDAEASKLYVSSSDFQPATQHNYSVGVLKGHGFRLFRCQRVTLDGLAASAFRHPVGREILLLPVSGFMLQETHQCFVRNCTAYYNGSGITINSGVTSRNAQPDLIGGNVVEDCVTYANQLDGIVAYNPSGETIRNSRSFLNETYGARFYGSRDDGKTCLMENVVAWGNPGGDFWSKSDGLAEFSEEVRAEKCVAFGDCQFANFQHGMIGGRNIRPGERPTTIVLPEPQEAFLGALDENFADPLNFDFRLQATSSYRNVAGNDAHVGPHPFAPNVYYVATTGDDAGDGLSMATAWKTPQNAIRKLRRGDTLYIVPGHYAGDLRIAGEDVSIRGRGHAPVVLDGAVQITNCRNLSVERIEIIGDMVISNSRNTELTNCTFSGPSVRAEKAEDLRITHNVFVPALTLQDCSQTILSANIFAGAPAVLADDPNQTAYSSYNSYPDPDKCWQVGDHILSLDDLRPRNDFYSIAAAPRIEKTDSATQIANEYAFAGRGPLSTAIGPYREWKERELSLVGPVVSSSSGISADIEWWSNLPVRVMLNWGDTPACSNRKLITQNAFYSQSLTGLQPGKKYYVKIMPLDITPRADPARRFRIPSIEPQIVEFSTANAIHNPTTYHVAPEGDDALDGLTPATAWKSIQAAGNRVLPGDTVLLGAGTYPGTFYFRRTGEPGKAITFKAAPGERVIISGLGETLKAGFVLYAKNHYNIDSLYFCGYAGIEDNVAGAENAALLAKNCSDLNITRCQFTKGWGPGLYADTCPDILVKNCVFMNSMSAATIRASANLRVENCIFIRTLIHHLNAHAGAGASGLVKNNIFSENTRGKVHICFLRVFPGTREANNCFYTRWMEPERKVINDLTLPEYRAQSPGTESFMANPYMPGVTGFRRGSENAFNLQKTDDPYDPVEFDCLFATNPYVVLRDIGLQPEAFRDFHFWKQDWPFTKEWAAQTVWHLDAAEAMAIAGNHKQAATAFNALAQKTPMSEQFKAHILDRAAECAALGGDYAAAIAFAKSISVESLSIRRQMAILFAQDKFAELLSAFPDKPGLNSKLLDWMCPDNEMVMAEAFYYRGTAYAETGNLEAAEEDLRAMIDKGEVFGYSPGPTALDQCYKRLGDFYRLRLHDDDKALDAYMNVISRTTVCHTEKPLPKPVPLGVSEVLVAATQAACDILRKQGKEEETQKLQDELQEIQKEAREALRAKL